MEFNEILKRFYAMEADLKLFERKDANGIYYWDIFRFDIFDELTEGGQSSSNNKGKVSNRLPFISLVKQLLNNIKIIFRKRCNFYIFASSRNRYNGTSTLFDQNTHGLISMLPKDQVLVQETYAADQKTLYDEYDRLFGLNSLARLFKKPRIVPFDEFNELVQEIKSVFPQSKVTLEQFINLYYRFYKERQLYKVVFKNLCVEKVFMSQNGLQKGLFAAAKDSGVLVYEMQHGIVNDGHLAYSYPRIDGIDDKVYRPAYMCTLSDFWLKDVYMPYTKKIVLGNDYFKPSIDISKKPQLNKILVVSSSFMRNELWLFLDSCKEYWPDFRKYEIVYKLHPNEYSCVEEYKEHFREFNNITVSTNEKNISQWMEDCSTLLTILSTAAYEALQCNRKVIVLKKLNYQMMQVLFCCDNIYTIDDVDDFSNAIVAPFKETQVEFFSSFNTDVACKILK